MFLRVGQLLKTCYPWVSCSASMTFKTGLIENHAGGINMTAAGFDPLRVFTSQLNYILREAADIQLQEQPHRIASNGLKSLAFS